MARDNGVDEAMKPLKSVSCNDSNLTEYTEESIGDLDSADTLIFKFRLDIVLPLIEPTTNAMTTTKTKFSLNGVLIKKIVLNM